MYDGKLLNYVEYYKQDESAFYLTTDPDEYPWLVDKESIDLITQREGWGTSYEDPFYIDSSTDGLLDMSKCKIVKVTLKIEPA